MSERTLTKLAKPLLALAAFIWGSSFFIMKNSLDSMPVFFLLGTRFLAATGILSLIFLKRFSRLRGDYLSRGAIMGVLLFFAYTSQTFGLAGTTPSKNAFLTAAYCVLVPFFYWGISKTRPDRYHIGAAFLLLTGIGFVSLTGDFTISPGDWLTLLCAVFYALHIVSVSIFAKGRDIILLTILQFVTVGVLSWLCSFLFETAPASLPAENLWSLAYLSVMATAAALLFQNVGQKYSSPVAASVLLSLESVFGVLCSLLFYGDVLTLRLAIGFLLIFVAVLCSETKFSFLRKRGANACRNESPGS